MKIMYYVDRERIIQSKHRNFSKIRLTILQIFTNLFTNNHLSNRTTTNV